mgnify:CR=1 FL=1|tara:strand:+ start:388 stop:570 length:183 start_codon:yes stop_codon:yes gene_type:complete
MLHNPASVLIMIKSNEINYKKEKERKDKRDKNIEYESIYSISGIIDGDWSSVLIKNNKSV